MESPEGLPRELCSEMRGRIVIVGVGDERHGDDGAGPLAIRLLRRAGVENLIDAGASPEIETWRIRQFAPDTVLFVDAADFGGEPGDAALLKPGDLRIEGFDTHRAPLRLTMEYLESELEAKCLLLAVQPRNVTDGAPMCSEVARSVEHLVAFGLSPILSVSRDGVSQVGFPPAVGGRT